MINVKLLYRRPDGATAEGVAITTGEVAIQSVRRYDTTNGEMTPAAFKVPIGSTVALDAGTWRFILINVPDGLGDFFTGADAVSVRSVPVSVPTTEIPAGKVNGDGSVDVDDLPETTVDNSPISSSPEWKAYVDAAIASVSAGTPAGGPFVAVADTTTLSRSLLAAGTQSAARGVIGAGTADDTAVVHLAGTETISGTKTFSAVVTVATPTASGHAATKAYVDTQAASGTPDATTSTKGKVQLAGDLAGTSAAPTVAKVNGITVTGTPTTGQALVATSGTAASWAGVTPAITGVSDVPGLVTALAGKLATLAFEPGDTFTVRKDTVTGFWPSGWTGKTPSYTGGSASAGVRPTSDATVTCIWKGADPSPAIVSSGTAGMLNNVDMRFVH